MIRCHNTAGFVQHDFGISGDGLHRTLDLFNTEPINNMFLAFQKIPGLIPALLPKGGG
jgi:hypothetical protein